jgi:hypothetical protein
VCDHVADTFLNTLGKDFVETLPKQLGEALTRLNQSWDFATREQDTPRRLAPKQRPLELNQDKAVMPFQHHAYNSHRAHKPIGIVVLTQQASTCLHLHL